MLMCQLSDIAFDAKMCPYIHMYMYNYAEVSSVQEFSILHIIASTQALSSVLFYFKSRTLLSLHYLPSDYKKECMF